MNSKKVLIQEKPFVAVDTVLFTVVSQKLKVLLVRIGSGLYKDTWAMPGGLVKVDESLDDAAKRVLFERTNISGIYLEQLYSFGEVKRDARGRSISVAYYALVDTPNKYTFKKADFYQEMDWFEIDKVPALAFDHNKILYYALNRLRNKLTYTNIAYSLLPKRFTLSQLQKIYEVILDEKQDKRNFRKKIISLGIVIPVNEKTKGVSHRPAQLFKFSERQLTLNK